MSEFSKNEILIALINAGNVDAQAYALNLVSGTNDNGTNANKSSAPEVETPVNIGHETDATTLDKAGLPWDSRIHAKTKTTNKDGTWKYAVGVDREVLVPQVEAELRAAGYGQTEQPTTPPAAVTPPPGAPTPAATPGLPPAAGAAPGLPPTTPPVAPPAPKVDFPVVSSEDDMDENALTQTVAALYAKHGEQAVINLLALFQVPEGGTVKDIQAGYKFPFWQYATNDENLKLQKIID
nr:MAG: hypothetical protein [Bacteriophage sp.]